jgi:hypothetical protein
MSRHLIIIVLSILLGSVAAYPQVYNAALHDQLISMEDADHAARRDCTKAGTTAEQQGSCILQVANTVDASNTRRLEEIFAEFGFPGKSIAGEDGLRAFLIMRRHTSADTLRERSLRPITRAFKNKEISPMDYANFVDGLRLRQNERQLYGSGFEARNGKLVLKPTKNIKGLDKRRAKIGLPPLSEHTKMLKEIYHLEVEVPPVRYLCRHFTK